MIWSRIIGALFQGVLVLVLGAGIIADPVLAQKAGQIRGRPKGMSLSVSTRVGQRAGARLETRVNNRIGAKVQPSYTMGPAKTGMVTSTPQTSPAAVNP